MSSSDPARTAIDWGRLAQALAFYEARGFERVELDWHASRTISAWTCPDAQRMYAFDDDVLVGSAEQGFMQAQVEGRLVPGKRYVALTPCFRREPVLSDTHRLQFMKVELYTAGTCSLEEAHALASVAKDCLKALGSCPVEVVPTPEGLDLEIAGLEVGSYAARRHGEHAWTCGTGLAEPRFSIAVNRHKTAASIKKTD